MLLCCTSFSSLFFLKKTISAPRILCSTSSISVNLNFTAFKKEKKKNERMKRGDCIAYLCQDCMQGGREITTFGTPQAASFFLLLFFLANVKTFKINLKLGMLWRRIKASQRHIFTFSSRKLLMMLICCMLCEI